VKSSLDIYRETFFLEPVVILGRRMLPLTLGHAVMLDRMGIGKIAEPEDLLMAVLICSMPVETFERKAESRLFGLWISWWSDRAWRRWLRDPESFARSLKLFGEYLDEQTSCPDYEVVGRTEEIQGGTPRVQQLRALLISKLNYSPETVMRTSFTQAHWDYYAYLESEMAIRVINGRNGETHAARFAQADALRDEMLRKAREQFSGKENGG